MGMVIYCIDGVVRRSENKPEPESVSRGDIRLAPGHFFFLVFFFGVWSVKEKKRNVCWFTVPRPTNLFIGNGLWDVAQF